MSETKDPQPFGWQGDAVAAALAETSIKFNLSAADTIAAFKNNGQREIAFDDEGKPHAKYDGEILPLSDALTRWAADSPDGTCDRRTLPRSPGGGRKGIASKADLVDAKSKSEYIKAHGYDAFAALPTKAQPTEELQFKDQYYALPLSEKVRLNKQYGDGFLGTLRDRPRDFQNGTYINRDKLAQIAKIKGRSAR